MHAAFPKKDSTRSRSKYQPVEHECLSRRIDLALDECVYAARVLLNKSTYCPPTTATRLSFCVLVAKVIEDTDANLLKLRDTRINDIHAVLNSTSRWIMNFTCHTKVYTFVVLRPGIARKPGLMVNKNIQFRKLSAREIQYLTSREN